MALQQHPIPQHIASFEFRLVGNLTLKQFSYLAIGGLFAWLFFISPLYPLIKWPISLFIATVGISFAFVPIQGRPFDKWVTAFIKAVFNPTQRVWRKENEHLYFLEIQPKKLPEEGAAVSKAAVARRLLEKYLTQVPRGISTLDEREQAFLQSLDFGVSMPAKVAFAVSQVAEEEKAKKKPVVKPLPPTLPPPTPEEKREFLPGLLERERKMKTAQAIIPLASEVNFVEKEVLTLPSPGLAPTYLTRIGEVKVRKLHTRPDLSGEFLMPVYGEKKFELSPALKARLGLLEEQPQEAQVIPAAAQVPAISGIAPSKKEEAPTQKGVRPKIQPTEKKVKKEEVPERKIEIVTSKKPVVATKIPPLTTTPNIVSGIVKDPNDRLAEGAILIVKNEAGIPVRALKTNKLGQFIISTPLPAGHYQVETEKEELSFDIIEFDATGKIIPPIEIRAKSRKDALA